MMFVYGSEIYLKLKIETKKLKNISHFSEIWAEPEQEHKI